MKIEAENNRYHGDKGWESDLSLFSDVVITWKQWLGSSGEHIHAAHLLLPSIIEHEKRMESLMKTGGSMTIPPVMTSIFFFHCALAIENSLKGVIVAHDSSRVKSHILEKGKIPYGVLGHDLNELSIKAGYEQDINIEYILTFLTRYGIWSGKYPTPIKNSDSDLTVKLSNGNNYMVGGYNPKVVPSYLEFSETVYQWAREKLTKLS
jgi:hypothetical protein